MDVQAFVLYNNICLIGTAHLAEWLYLIRVLFATDGVVTMNIWPLPEAKLPPALLCNQE
jgi:hypothetical protein